MAFLTGIDPLDLTSHPEQSMLERMNEAVNIGPPPIFRVLGLDGQGTKSNTGRGIDTYAIQELQARQYEERHKAAISRLASQDWPGWLLSVKKRTFQYLAIPPTSV